MVTGGWRFGYSPHQHMFPFEAKPVDYIASYHYKNSVHATGADRGRDELHHIVLAEMDVHVSRRRQDEPLSVFELHFGRW